jgi:hypothetical protein
MMHRDRRNDLAKEALDTGMDDVYWLHNLSIDLRYHGGHDDLLDQAERLRQDAQVLEDAHEKLKEDDWTGGEAAVYIARRVNKREYDVREWLNQEMPITEEP